MSTDLQTLAIRTAGALGMTDEAAAIALEDHARQVEALESRTIDRDDISELDADVLLEACRQSQRSGEYGARELAALGEVAVQVQDLEDRLAELRAERDHRALVALGVGARASDVAESGGVSRAWLVKLRRGR